MIDGGAVPETPETLTTRLLALASRWAERCAELRVIEEQLAAVDDWLGGESCQLERERLEDCIDELRGEIGRPA